MKHLKDMDKNQKNNGPCDPGNNQDCGCGDNCCPPKKSNVFRTILFAVVILAALGVVAFKLTSPAVPAPAKEACCPPGSTAACDTAKAGCDDTTKSSTCCPKK
jgi:hypothetical protein